MKLKKTLLLLFFVMFTIHGFAQSSAELKRRRDKITSELEKLNDEYTRISSDKKTSLKQLSLLKAQIDLREEKIKTANSEIRLLDHQISDNSNNVRSLQSQLDQLKKEYAAMVLFAFRNQSAYNKLMFVFAASDFNQAYKRLKYMQQFGDYRRRQAGYIEGTQKDLHIKIIELDHNKKEKNNILIDQEKEKEKLGKEKDNQAEVVNTLSKQEKLTKNQIAKQKKARDQLNRAISNAIRREIEEERRKAAEEARIAAAKAKAENKPAAVAKPASKGTDVLSATPEAAKLSNDFLGNRGRLPWPVANGVIVGRFGMTYIQGIKTENPGVDIKTNAGAAVRSVFSGEVSKVENVDGSYLVVIRHGEYFTAYINLRSASVTKGQKVSLKQTIGVAGVDPESGDTQVHFELWKGFTPQNPQSWIAEN
ncbi:peptidoglycan DD-metalloendopeptidase family protein [Mucilaginibacter sp. HMF7410]|uniref:Peptidoglycan DD-metalloendopeptidase family protein n=2 Tax=Mucilaginibacter arboris TaxID=2682090 RepID=A0A7K1SRL7_9SPHI|nr:peptidoglycan DD-metalloendopeptidase family protein [Mucilaginibacter arboris]